MATDTTQGYSKFSAAILAGSLTTIVVYVCHVAFNLTLPTEVTEAIQTLVVGGAVWFTPHSVTQSGGQ
jgi:hypothetical protein